MNLIRCLRKIVVTNTRYNHSYVFGKSNESLVPLLLSDIIERNAIECPQSIACISRHQNITKSYAQLSKDVNKLTKVLKELGCQKGTRVGIWAHNRYEWIVTQFATAKLGSILVNVNPGYKMNELKYCLDLVGCHTLISSQRIKTSNYFEILQNLMPSLSSCTSTKNIETEQVSSLRNIVMLSHSEEPAPKNFVRFNDLMNNVSDEDIEVNDVYFDDAVNIQFTSVKIIVFLATNESNKTDMNEGTTGNPKGATLSHHNLINNARFVSKGLMEQIETDKPVICCQVPLYHAFGSVGGSIGSVITKGTIVFPSETFNPKESLEAIQEFKCNFLYGTPTMMVDLLNTPIPISKYDTSHIIRGAMGGSICTPELIRSLHKAIPTLKHIFIVYGTTELSPGVSMTSIYDSEDKRFETVGKAIDHTEIKIVDHKTGKLVPIGQPGEIFVRGYCTFLGYWNQEDKTKEVMDNTRWYRTGDIGTMDEDGYIRILSRIKEMIIRGGENIYPREVEEFILSNPDVADVHVVGVPDHRMGEEMCAFIRLKSNQTKLTEKDIKTFLKDKISHFKIPRYIEFVDDYPRTVTGKVQKFVLKDIAVKKYGK